MCHVITFQCFLNGVIIYRNNLVCTAKNTDILVSKNKQISGAGYTSVLEVRMKSAFRMKNIDQGTIGVSDLPLALNFHILIKQPYHLATLVHV